MEIDLGLEAKAAGKGKEAKKVYKGKPEYAPPYFTVNIAHVEHLPAWETVGVNGEVLQITRGVDVPNIPAAHMHVLKNSIASRQVTIKNNDGTERTEWQPYPSIPFSVVEGPYMERKAV